MMKLDMDMFVQEVKKINDIHTEHNTDGLKYLYDVVAPAVFKNKELYVKDVDFSRFTAYEYECFCEEITDDITNTQKLYSIMCSAEAKNISKEKEFF